MDNVHFHKISPERWKNEELKNLTLPRSYTYYLELLVIHNKFVHNRNIG